MGIMSRYWITTAMSLRIPSSPVDVVKKATRDTMPKMDTTPLV